MLRDLGWSNAIRIVIGHRPSRITHAFRSIWLYSTTRSAAIVLATVTGDCKEGIGATRGTGRNSHVGAPISHTSHNCTVPSFVHHRLSPFVIVFHCLILISLNHCLTPQPPEQDICKQINNAPALTASQTTFPPADSIPPFSTLERDNHH